MTTQTATILVTDLVGSTALRADLGEERAESVRREHDRALIDAAEGNGGTVVKGLGDGVLVMFAGAAEAIAAAVAMQRAIELQARGAGFTLGIRVGLSAGDVSLEDGDCFGTPVVEASRLCAAAEGGQILIAEVIRVLARGRGGHEMTSVGDLELKGLAEPVPTFRVAWEPAQGAADLRARTPYVGRERERAVIASRIAAARDGAGGLVLIAGEPGIGKSRLVAEACAAADEVTVLVGGCHDGDVVPYAPFAEAITDWVRRTPNATVTPLLGGDAAIVGRIAPAIHDVLPAVGEPLPVSADAETARLHDAVGQVLLRLSEGAPVLLVVDDLHWADDATVGMLRSLARLALRTRLVVVGTYRETDLDRRHPFAQALPLLQREAEPTRIALDGLGTADVQTMLERLSGQDVPEAFAALLATETDGNPFFLRETLLHLVEEGRLVVVDGAWVADGDGDFAIPAGVREVVGRRLSRLSPDANKLLAAGALFEVSFPLAIVAAVTKIDEDAALDAIDDALEARIVAPTDEFDRYMFTHALFRHTLVEELNPSRQVRMHRAIAEAIEKELRGEPDPTTAATLARHYLHSAAIPGGERGVPYALAVANDAAARYARHEELAALRTALELIEDGDDRAVDLRSRSARAAVLAVIDPDEQLAESEAALELVAATDGRDAACDFGVELLRTARSLEVVSTSWRLANAIRPFLRPDRRDFQWAMLRDAELEELSFLDPLAPGIPTDDEAYRELRAVLATRPLDEQLLFTLCGGPASRVEAEGMNSQGATLIWSLGHWIVGVERCGTMISRWREERLAGNEALFLALRSRLEAVLGRFDDAAKDLDAAFAFLPRVAPESNQAFQVLATPLLRDLLCGVAIAPDAITFMLASSERPDTRWAGLVLRLAAAFGLATAGDNAAIDILDESMVGIDRAAAWAPNAPAVFALATLTAWRTEHTKNVAALERNVREKWLEPDLCYPGTESRWSLALLCALDGRVEEARHWFAESRRVLLEQESEPVIAAVDHDGALMELRLGTAGDRERFDECIASARARCTHVAMAAWLPQLDDLEARAFGLF